MILVFSDFDSVAMCLSGEMIPTEMATAPASYAVAEDGAVWIKTKAKLTRTARAKLKDLGIDFPRLMRKPKLETLEVSHWFEMISVNAIPEDALANAGNVIFEMEDPKHVSPLVHEILRQGNDRQSLRSIEIDGISRTQLRVAAPPYFTLLRALHDDISNDHSENSRFESEPSLRAYVETSSRVWTELGFQHPLSDRVKPSAGEQVFIDRFSSWRTVADVPFDDLYSVAEFQLPSLAIETQSSELPTRLEVPLQLYRGGNENDSPEMWTISANGIAALETFVNHSADHVLERLSFAVVENQNEQPNTTAVLIRIRPSRDPLPVLPFDGIGVGYRTISRISNLYVPMGQKLHPPLRRDAIRKVVAPNEHDVVWLEPKDESEFRTCTVNERAFEPLTKWIDYVLDQNREELSAWMQSTQFDFSDFVCGDGEPLLSKSKAQKKPKSKDKQSVRVQQESALNHPDEDEQTATRMTLKRKKPEKKKATAPATTDAEREQLIQELRLAEAAFVQVDAPLDAPERTEAWHQIADLNEQLKRYQDAAVCRLHLLWDGHIQDPIEYREWLQTTVKAGGRKHALTNKEGRFSDENINALLKNQSPLPVEVLQFAALIVWSVRGKRPLDSIRSRLNAIQQFLNKHESLLPVRAAWMCWLALSEIAGGDVLQLAHSRDRLLERLFQSGLTLDLEVPSFLRSAGSDSSDRFRQVKERLVDLRETVREWSKRNLRASSPATHCYVDMIYAYGLARLGEPTAAQELFDSASQEMSTNYRKDVHVWLRHAFRQRIREAVNGETPGALSDDLLEELDVLSKIDRYKADRLRQNSFIIEPHESMDPYHNWKRSEINSLKDELEKLFDLHDRSHLKSELTSLFARRVSSEDRCRLLTTALELSIRLGQKQAIEWLGQVDGTLKPIKDPRLKAELLQRSLAVAAHFGQSEFASALFQQLRSLVQSLSKTDLDVLKEIESMLAQSFRVLRRLGMRDQLAELLDDLSTLVRSIKSKKHELERHILLLHLAGGSFYFGNEKGWKDIDRARQILFKNGFKKEGHAGADKQTKLTIAYITAVGQAPIHEAMSRFEELFPKLNGIHDSGTYNSHYSLKQLKIIEMLIRTVVSEDFSVDKASLRWIDEEEYLIRRRIHRDVDAAINQE